LGVPSKWKRRFCCSHWTSERLKKKIEKWNNQIFTARIAWKPEPGTKVAKLVQGLSKSTKTIVGESYTDNSIMKRISLFR
jgi:hypothetical protein